MFPDLMGIAYNWLIECSHYNPQASLPVHVYSSLKLKWTAHSFFLFKGVAEIPLSLAYNCGHRWGNRAAPTDGLPCLHTSLPDMARGHQQQWEGAEHTPEAAQCACGKTWTQDISLSGQPPSHRGKWNWLLLMKITAAKCAHLVLWRKPVAVSRVTNRRGSWRKWPGSLLWIYSVNHCSWFPGRDRQVPVWSLGWAMVSVLGVLGAASCGLSLVSCKWPRRG